MILISDDYQIDIDKNIYRKYYSILGFKYGKWQACPDFEYISIIKSNVRQRFNGKSSTILLHRVRFFVNIFYNEFRHITFSMEENLEDAIEVAKLLEKNLKIEILKK